ncbi:VOC family protein [Alkaliphilus transvaalensis]|uniref:VOC family protein n=1 Tax=Alkaliphilus transvaalensis TaxID=114628 RepID=UPI00047E197D|nr:VOC family protein [Alkaliphilus transvaalensis]
MEKKFKFTRIGYAYIPTSNLERSIDWYTKHLEFKLMDKFEDRGSFLAVLHHPHKHAIGLLLIETKDKQSLQISRNGEAFPIMAFNCPDIDYTHKTLRANGVEVGDLHSLGNGEAKYFYFRDQEGNLLEAAWSLWDTKDEIKEGFYKED